MSVSSPGGKHVDKENYKPESKSNLRISAGCFPCEDTVAHEGTTSYEKPTCVAPSICFLPPESERSPIERKDQVLDNPEKLCKLNITLFLNANVTPDPEDPQANLDLHRGNQKDDKPFGRLDKILSNPENLCKVTITLVTDADSGSNHADLLADLDINGDNQMMDKCQQERIKQTLSTLEALTQKLKAVLDKQKDDNHDGAVLSDSPLEDVQLSSSVSTHPYQISHLKPEGSEALPKLKLLKNEDIIHFLEAPSRFEEYELDMIKQVTGRVETYSSSVRHPEDDEPTETETTCCLHLRSMFLWIRKRLVSILPERKHRERAPMNPHTLTPNKRHFRTDIRIQPQESRK